MIDVIVEELESPDCEDGGLDTDVVPYRHYTLVMKSLKQPACTYLLIDSKEEKVCFDKSLLSPILSSRNDCRYTIANKRLFKNKCR